MIILEHYAPYNTDKIPTFLVHNEDLTRPKLVCGHGTLDAYD